MSTIEQVASRVNKYNQFTSNLDLLIELFTSGDVLVKKGNELLTIIKTEIDTGVETVWTKEDFNTMLYMRNAILTPIFENASFAMQFDPYIINNG